ncbi:uncharacterized protein LOC103982034 [Musa acuminata AAA Group]|uniref:uncharacterized protein LOC103982034 n=1 Tax=Musa acuminata AAA Group TaxID=214697 RepID=UPI0031E47C55
MASSSTITTSASASSSSVGDDHHHSFGDAAIPSPPPPTPSNQSLANSLPADADAALSRLLHQLLATPTLSRPSPRRRSPHPASPPVISFDQPLRSDLLLSAASDFGFFHLAGHGVPSDLAYSAVADSRSLLQSQWLPVNNLLSLGLNRDDCDGDSLDHDDQDRILMLDTSENGDAGGFASFPALQEFSKCLEKVGLGVVQMLSAMERGFCENPFEKRNYTPRCLLWISSHHDCSNTGKLASQTGNCKCYPYVVGLQYEMNWWRQPCYAIGDSGERICIAPIADSILVTLGDIAQVWSNGRFKKVRSRPEPPSLPFDGRDGSGCISVTVLVTIPLDSVISPLMPLSVDGCVADIGDEGDDDDDDGKRFHAFCLEEYAWKVYHERLTLKDPLLRYWM